MNDPRQFGSFDGLDNRREVLRMFERMGEGVPDDVASARRAEFLSGLMGMSRSPMAGLGLSATPATPTEAYYEFVAITGVMGVSIEEAAVKLEDMVRRKNDRRASFQRS